MVETRNQFKPDYVIPPGSILAEILEEQGLRQTDLAERTGMTPKTINEIVKGKARITPDTALGFERVLGVSAGFWNNAQARYDEHRVRLEEEARLSANLDWLKNFSCLRQMVKLGWIEEGTRPVQQLSKLLEFFSISKVEQFNTVWENSGGLAFRLSEPARSDPFAVAAWLRQGERVANQIYCSPFDNTRFTSTLQEARALTVIEDPSLLMEKLTTVFAQSGIALVFLRELKGARINGAVRWLNPNKAVIQLSLRHGWADIMWFSLFHEAGHLLQNKCRQWQIDDKDRLDKESELLADQFASSQLIPEKDYLSFLHELNLSADGVKQFAQRIGIHPGIVVGRLHHEKRLPESHLNDLRVRYQWATSV